MSLLKELIKENRYGYYDDTGLPRHRDDKNAVYRQDNLPRAAGDEDDYEPESSPHMDELMARKARRSGDKELYRQPPEDDMDEDKAVALNRGEVESDDDELDVSVINDDDEDEMDEEDEEFNYNLSDDQAQELADEVLENLMAYIEDVPGLEDQGAAITSARQVLEKALASLR
jgi:hypothetical protein